MEGRGASCGLGERKRQQKNMWHPTAKPHMDSSAYLMQLKTQQKQNKKTKTNKIKTPSQDKIDHEQCETPSQNLCNNFDTSGRSACCVVGADLQSA